MDHQLLLHYPAASPKKQGAADDTSKLLVNSVGTTIINRLSSKSLRVFTEHNARLYIQAVIIYSSISLVSC